MDNSYKISFLNQKYILWFISFIPWSRHRMIHITPWFWIRREISITGRFVQPYIDMQTIHTWCVQLLAHTNIHVRSTKISLCYKTIRRSITCSMNYFRFKTHKKNFGYHNNFVPNVPFVISPKRSEVNNQTTMMPHRPVIFLEPSTMKNDISPPFHHTMNSRHNL